MANFELKFKDVFIENYSIKAESGYHVENDICVISITSNYKDYDFTINLDKSTAIKFAKTLRTEINKITEQEAKDGNR